MYRRFVRTFRRYREAAAGVFSLLAVRRNYWLVPLLLMLLLVSLFILLTEASALSPLIYTLF